jgi:ring-1,2-phenylacetyl-CoA epoxidase subunit PaaB
MSNNKIMDEQGLLWEVFIQAKPGIPHKHAGSVHATDAETALSNARDVYTRRNEGFSIWVTPSNAIVASAKEDEDAFFDPANDKIYRHPTFYEVPEGVKYL